MSIDPNTLPMSTPLPAQIEPEPAPTPAPQQSVAPTEEPAQSPAEVASLRARMEAELLHSPEAVALRDRMATSPGVETARPSAPLPEATVKPETKTDRVEKPKVEPRAPGKLSPALEGPRTGKTLLKAGSKGPEVLELQKQLNKTGLFKPPLPENGQMDKATIEAVKRFQAATGCKPDGIVGPETMGALDAAAGFKPSEAALKAHARLHPKRPEGEKDTWPELKRPLEGPSSKEKMTPKEAATPKMKSVKGKG